MAPVTTQEKDQWPQTEQAEATAIHLLRRLWALWTSQSHSSAVQSKGHPGPISLSLLLNNHLSPKQHHR